MKNPPFAGGQTGLTQDQNHALMQQKVALPGHLSDHKFPLPNNSGLFFPDGVAEEHELILQSL